MTDDNALSGRTQTLCQKYGITDSQLDFKYVQECKNPKELEKILKILRSNEVGYFERLQEATEERLRQLAPDNRCLVKPQPVSSWNELGREEQDELSRNFLNWSSTEKASQQELKREAEESPRDYPAVRNSVRNFTSNKAPPPKRDKIAKSCVPRSFESWDKFDVDKEISLIDREEELKQIAIIRAKNESKTKEDECQEACGIEEVGAGDAHKQEAALQERRKGNEFFKEKKYFEALHHYNKSLKLSPSAEVHNNRAQLYINLKKYHEALLDCQKVLELSQTDVNVVSKALFRRSTALKELKHYDEAYEAILRALEKDPNNKEIQQRANELKERVALPSMKKVRMVIQDQETRPNSLIEEVDQRDTCYPFKSVSDYGQLSDIGTARMMCQCSGVPPFIAKLRSAESLPNTNRLCLRKTRSKKSFCEKNLSNRRAKKASSLMNGEIIEKDKIEDVEKTVYKNHQMQPTNAVKSNLIISLERGDLDLIVKELVSLHPTQICAEFASRLDPATLNLCVMALCVNLKQHLNWKPIQDVLVAFSQLPQFRSSVKSLEKSTKDALSKTIALVEEQGQRVSNIVTLYGLNGALPPPT